MDIDRFRKKPVLGILRTDSDVDTDALADSLSSAGLEAIEVAMNSKRPGELIRGFTAASSGRLMVGAGTVTTMDRLKAALDAGATFIVMPCLIDEVVEYCVRNGIQVFPGALTPREVYDAWEAGATMVKVFPAGQFGPPYIKELKAPFDKIELLACGGVNPQNIKGYFDAGASAVAFGASILRPEWLERRDYGAISNSVKDLLRHAA